MMAGHQGNVRYSLILQSVILLLWNFIDDYTVNQSSEATLVLRTPLSLFKIHLIFLVIFIQPAPLVLTLRLRYKSPISCSWESFLENAWKFVSTKSPHILQKDNISVFLSSNIRKSDRSKLLTLLKKFFVSQYFRQRFLYEPKCGNIDSSHVHSVPPAK